MLLFTWFERISMGIILLNCVTLGMFQPCADMFCTSTRCRILEAFDHLIFVFFALEMCVKVFAMGLWGKKAYLGDTWNRLDLFIVIAGFVLYYPVDKSDNRVRLVCVINYYYVLQS